MTDTTKPSRGKKTAKKASFRPTNGRKPKTPLKRSSLGFEVEFFILNKNGAIVPEASTLLKELEKRGSAEIIGEAAENMIEAGSYPSLETADTMQSLLESLQKLSYVAEKNNLMLCPLATYPGKFNPKMRSEADYKVQQKLFGKQRFSIAGRAVGFHFHYA
jgi:gamma-glutamyl:cysteine ligase YbdK (ATP-grasp superfamily)